LRDTWVGGNLIRFFTLLRIPFKSFFFGWASGSPFLILFKKRRGISLLISCGLAFCVF
jgi:hypothetical protein